MGNNGKKFSIWQQAEWDGAAAIILVGIIATFIIVCAVGFL